MSKPAAAEVDLVNRDPHNMNGYLQVEWDDAFGEPVGTHSADCVWRNSFKCFTCSKNLCYQILTYVFGIITAFMWGCAFAELSFYIIWCIGPYLRYLHIALYPIRKIQQIILSTFVAPWMEALGLFFGRIHVTNAQGAPNKPFGQIDGDDNQKK